MKLDLDIQELRLIEAGLELRNAHNVKAINGKLNVPIHVVSSCAEELNKIIKIQEKIQKAYRENAIEEKLNAPKTLEENERMFEIFISGFVGVDISELLGVNIPVIIEK